MMGTATSVPSIPDVISETMNFNQYHEKSDVVYVYDLGRLKKLYQQWKERFPYIHPYYAVKCNPDKQVLKTLASCGANFDCASPNEITQVLSIGVDPSRILYANPCKRETDIMFMKKHGVTKTTCDSICELDKLATIYPEVTVVIRIYANDPTAQCILSNKFGAFPEEWEGLLYYAAQKNMRVEGVSFHVGSGACNPEVFKEALTNAKEFVTIASKYGHHVNIIDIGGGFSVSNVATMSNSIHKSIKQHFGDGGGDYKFIAEPGRYFAETIASMHTKIMGVRERRGVRDYFIPDGLYGSFNCVFYDHSHPRPVAINKIDETTELVSSTIFGPTCDGADLIVDGVLLPRLEYGDWLSWFNMGAYTIAGACDFNGIVMTKPKCIYITDKSTKI